MRISPDQTRIVGEAFVEGQGAIWLYDLDRDLSTLVVPPGLRNLDPSWHPSGDFVTYSDGVETGGDSLLMIPVRGDGDSQLLWFNPDHQFSPHAWSPDGRFLAAYEINPETGRDIWLLSPGEEPEVFLATEANERSPIFSPDGRWLAYASDKSGLSEVWVTSFPDKAVDEQVSVGGGRAPTWRGDGREIFFRKGNRIYAVSIQLEPTLEIGRPRELFRGPFNGEPEVSGSLDYDVMPDGSRFLLSRIELPDQIDVLVNWIELLENSGEGR
jgi:Tol biopolymer transport system component